MLGESARELNRLLLSALRKVERRTGMRVELTALERRLPVIFIWPRVFRVLRNRPAEEAAAGRAVPPGSEGDT